MLVFRGGILLKKKHWTSSSSWSWYTVGLDGMAKFWYFGHFPPLMKTSNHPTRHPCCNLEDIVEVHFGSIDTLADNSFGHEELWHWMMNLQFTRIWPMLMVLFVVCCLLLVACCLLLVACCLLCVACCVLVLLLLLLLLLLAADWTPTSSELSMLFQCTIQRQSLPDMFGNTAVISLDPVHTHHASPC